MLTLTLTIVAAVAAVAGIPHGASATTPTAALAAHHAAQSAALRHWQDD